MASLPMRLGGLFLRSVEWCQERVGLLGLMLWRWFIRDSLECQTASSTGCTVAVGGCLGELPEVDDRLDRQGFVGRPGWAELKLGAHLQHTQLSQVNGPMTGSTTSGRRWCCPPPAFSLRRRLLQCAPSPEFRVEAALHRTLILERLRLPLAVTEGRCKCGDWVDSKGRHRAACPHAGRLPTRAVAPERTLARVLRPIQLSAPGHERGGEGRRRKAHQGPRIRLPLFHGAQLVVDITLRSALTSNGEPRPGSARVDGPVCETARADKETKYAELWAGDRCRLVVVALETGGKWSFEAIQFVESLASSRAREEQPTLVRQPGMEETMGAHDLHILRRSMRYTLLLERTERLLTLSVCSVRLEARTVPLCLIFFLT